MPKRLAPVLVLFGLLAGSVWLISRPAAVVAQSDGHAVQLPNGWKLTPAGVSIQIGELPLGQAMTRDGRTIFLTQNGRGRQSVLALDTAERRILAEAPVERAWLGIAWHEETRRLYVSGGGGNCIYVFKFEDGKLTKLAQFKLADASARLFPGGLAVTPDGKRLVVANNYVHEVALLDAFSGKILSRARVGSHPYQCRVHPDGRRVFVSNWAGASVTELSIEPLRVLRVYPAGNHPNDLAFDPAGRFLYVANANDNTVSVIDLQKGKTIETLVTSISAAAPTGSTPNGLAVSPSGDRLYVANADNNNVAVFALAPDRESRMLGLIPVGWYPTVVALTADNKTLIVCSGKGLASAPNRLGPNPYNRTTPRTQYIGELFKGAAAFIDIPDTQALQQYTAQAFENIPYRDPLLKAAGPSDQSVVPSEVGQPSTAIKYVVYIIKENRTYDQVFGDMPQGNGDPSLCLFGEQVTPNHHALARQFVLLDNFYADAEVSADGHNWSMAAYATDYVEKLWPTTYSGRGRPYDYEGTNPASYPTRGFLWDYCRRAGISYRSYGEFIENGKRPGKPGRATMASLIGHFDPYYRGFDGAYRDQKRVDRWLVEFRQFEKSGDLPRLQVLRLPNDHTSGTRPGMPTPRAAVADNDLALGRIVEAISRSRFWKETAIFVVEDDAQNGPDHVDAHRTVAFVVSPHVRRGSVDSTLYSTSSMLRTIELILGLPPMSQYDAAATPMFRCFQNQPNLDSYSALPNRHPLDEVNSPQAYGARQSLAMNLDEIDAAPEFELNEILWKSIRGAESPMPAPKRAVFVRPVE
ncbi:MAG: beta-propeller fold lactonase family protein [Acidobacteriota bacterium]